MILDISVQMLAKVLRTLAADALVSRKVYTEVPPKVEYSLTETGKIADSANPAANLPGAKGHGAYNGTPAPLRIGTVKTAAYFFLCGMSRSHRLFSSGRQYLSRAIACISSMVSHSSTISTPSIVSITSSIVTMPRIHP